MVKVTFTDVPGLCRFVLFEGFQIIIIITIRILNTL